MTRGIESQSALDGLLNTGIDAEESGIFTQEGKTRIWIDMIKNELLPISEMTLFGKELQKRINSLGLPGGCRNNISKTGLQQFRRPAHCK